MSIGEELTEARSRVGLTVTEVSERTRIRETIIRDIEHDDFASCGGDFYARGHIRAIAHVVDADPEPLIEDYDEAHNWSSGLEILRQGTEPSPSDPAAGDDAGSTAQEAWSRGAEPGASTQQFATVPEIQFPAQRTTAMREQSVLALATMADTLRRAGQHLRRPQLDAARGTGSRLNVTALLALALLAAIGVVAYLLATGSGSPASQGAAGPAPRVSAPGHHTTPAHGATGHPATSPRPAPAAAHAQALTPAAAVAFGPGGTAHGDNPQLASQALAGHGNQTWHTNWYTTPEFGNLQNGTGLLLDMGRNVTVTSARLILGDARGASLQLRAGNVAQFADLRTIATASDAGGTVVLQPVQPTQARYLLIWVTRLPPDNAGTFETWISDIQVRGLT